MSSIADPDVKQIVVDAEMDAGVAAQKCETARGHYECAIEFFAHRNLLGAIHECEAALADDPECLDAHMLLNRCNEQLADLMADVKEAQSHITRIPQDAERRVELANMLVVLGRHQEAQAELQAATALPDSYWVKRAAKELRKIGQKI